MGSGASTSISGQPSAREKAQKKLDSMDDSTLEALQESDVEAFLCGARTENKAVADATPDDLALLFEALGGIEKVKALKSKSQSLIAGIEASLPEDQSLDQHILYEGAGLEKLLADGAMRKPEFDKWGEAVCKTWSRKFDVRCNFVAAPVKGPIRSAVKVKVDLNGKVVALRDVVRGTIDVMSFPTPALLERLYDAIQDLVQSAGDVVPGLRAKVLRLKDRYQQPAGKYRDFLLNIRLKDFVCELQVNFSAALKDKEAKSHKDYEIERMAKANLLDAAMRGDATAVQVMVSTGVDIRGLKDSNNFSPLTYAAAYGNSDMVSTLLANGADPMNIDDAGRLPVHYALSQGFGDVAELLLDAMLKFDLSDVPDKLGPTLAKMFGIVIADPSLGYLEEKAFALWDLAKPDNEVKLVQASEAGEEEVCTRILQESSITHVRDMIFNPHSGTDANSLDCAIWGAGSESLVQSLAQHGVVFGSAFMHANPQLRAEQYASTDRVGSLRALLEAERQKVPLQFPDGSKVEWGSEDWPGTPLKHLHLVTAAAERNCSKSLRTMIHMGVKLSEQSEVIEHQLVASAGAGHLEFCELLLDAGAAVNATNLRGESALGVAAGTGQLATCQLLLSRRADVDLAEHNEHQRCTPAATPACLAAQTSRMEVLDLLFKARADFTKVGDGHSPLEWAQLKRKEKAEIWIQKVALDGSTHADPKGPL